MSTGPCLCGDPYCWSCGPAQGFVKCESCGCMIGFDCECPRGVPTLTQRFDPGHLANGSARDCEGNEVHPILAMSEDWIGEFCDDCGEELGT